MYTKFDRSNIDSFADEFIGDPLTKELEKKYGIKLSFGSITYTELELKCQLKVKINTPGQASAYKLFLQNIRYHYDVKPEMYGMEFPYRNKQYKVVGCKMGRTKHPLECIEMKSGKTTYFNVNPLNEFLKSVKTF